MAEPDAYAFYVDSHDSNNGVDSEGNIASIKSYNSSSGTVVSDKKYDITGNMLAKNFGVIDLHMGNYSNFTGYTAIENNGVLNLNILGADSTWRLTGDSSLSNLALMNGARLLPQGMDTHHTVKGQFNSTRGIIDLGANGYVGDTLTIDGDYITDGGHIALNTTLGDDSSLTDRLIVKGDTSGNGTIQVFDIGGLGAQTVKGIKVIEVQGNSAANFKLIGDYAHQGEEVAVAGAYGYALRKGGVDDESDWYLRSELLKRDPGVNPLDPKGPVEPLYNAGVPLYEAYPQLLMSLNSLPTLQQRLGERYWNLAGEGAEASTKDTSSAGNSLNVEGLSVRVEGGIVRSILTKPALAQSMTLTLIRCS